MDPNTTEPLVHLWNHCHNCNAEPIAGPRYHCQSCPDGPDNDLCEPCHRLFQQGKITHPAADSLIDSSGITDHQFTSYEGKPARLFRHLLEVKHPDTPAPSLTHPFVVRPIFTAGADSAFGSYAFVARPEKNGHPLLLTALHVMDQLIKQKGIDCTDENKNYSGKELPSIITEVNLFDLFAANWMMAPLGTAGPMLALPGSRTGDEEPYSDRDIAAFYLHPGDTGDIKPAPLARHSPSKGDALWLVARTLENPRPRLYKAVVVEITPRSMVFMYEDPAEKPKYCSGAPLVNKDGEVAGINVGGGCFDGQRLGHANHADNIRRHLEAQVGVNFNY
jgi:hypothetical protein